LYVRWMKASDPSQVPPGSSQIWNKWMETRAD
jgi:hypothetical protein